MKLSHHKKIDNLRIWVEGILSIVIGHFYMK